MYLWTINIWSNVHQTTNSNYLYHTTDIVAYKPLLRNLWRSVVPRFEPITFLTTSEYATGYVTVAGLCIICVLNIPKTAGKLKYKKNTVCLFLSTFLFLWSSYVICILNDFFAQNRILMLSLGYVKLRRAPQNTYP